MPRENAKEKKLARERQAVTGKPYAACLAEIRSEFAARQAARMPKPKGHP